MTIKHPLFEYLKKNMDEQHPTLYGNSYCYFKRPLETYKSMSTILSIAGHDTTEINNAINEVENAVSKLKKVTDTARSKFLLNGMQTTV